MAKKQNTEQEVDVADYMDRLADWAEKNAGKLVAGFLAFSVVVVAIWAVSAYQDRALNQAANTAGLVNRKIDLLEKAMLKVEDKTTADFKTKKNAEIGKINASVLDLIAKHSDRSVTDFTAVKWASFLVKEEQKGKALELLNQTKPSSARELSASLLMLKASLLAEDNKVDEAVKIFDEILADAKWSLFHSEALIQKGALLSSQGKLDAAMESFEKAKDKGKDSGFSKDASKYLRLLKVKKSNPDLIKSAKTEG